jgi:transcriptional regulator of acetoin/glycerol metabolism
MPPPLAAPARPDTPKPFAPDAGDVKARAPTEEELRGLLARHKGNVAAVGRELGKERMQVHRWLKKYDIRLEDYR